MIQQLLWSFTFRPYVTLFLLAFLALSWIEQGKVRTFTWLASGSAIAFMAEWMSINHGIPFGWYAYHYDALRHDLVLFGVPLFDSLSFSFLSYVSFSFAQFFMSPLWVRGFDIRRLTERRIRNSTPVLFLGAWLMVMIDLIVDPLADLGKYCFLGEIYYYPQPGAHFGIPLANYLGWLVVGLMTLFFNQRVDEWMAMRETDKPPAIPRIRYSGLFAPCFWAGIVLFNLGVTYWIAFHSHGADSERIKLQAVTGSFIAFSPLALAVIQVFKPSNRVAPEEKPG